MMGQSRRGSALESFVNITVGLIVSVVANHLVFPAFGFSPTLSENITISLIYTAISFARSYLLRRTFNHFGARA